MSRNTIVQSFASAIAAVLVTTALVQQAGSLSLPGHAAAATVRVTA